MGTQVYCSMNVVGGGGGEIGVGWIRGLHCNMISVRRGKGAVVRRWVS